MLRNFRHLLTAMALLLLPACDTLLPGSRGPLQGLWMEATGVVLAPGETIRLRALAEARGGSLKLPPESLLPAEDIRWWADDGRVLRTVDDGTVEASALGRTTVWVEAGNLRDSATVVVRDPEEEPSYRWKAVAVGESHVCALTIGGVPYCWGVDFNGLLGRGGTGNWRNWTSHLVPQRVAGDHRFVEIVAGDSHTCARKASNEVYCWGNSYLGATGQGHPEPQAISSPHRVAGNPRLARISSQWGTASALTPEGQVISWGKNYTGQIGDGIYGIANFRFSPTPAKTDERFVELATGNDHVCALTGEGRTWCWGRNEFPIIPSAEPRHPEAVPVPIEQGDVRFQRVAAGVFNTCALDENGTLYCWGGNSAKQAGHPDGLFVELPLQVLTAPSFTVIEASGYHACGITDAGEAFCWGGNARGQLGTASVVADECGELTPTACSATPLPVAGGQRWAHIMMGGTHHLTPSTCGVTTEGGLYCWGSNWRGKLGTGDPGVGGRPDPPPHTSPIPVRVQDPV
jgi:alpha-tubulin suppressor-like RCC1 family protein